MLEPYRAQIDELDAELVRLLARRFEIAGEISALKKAHQLPLRDATREEAHSAQLRRLARELGVDEDLVGALMDLIYAAVIQRYSV